MSDTISKSNLPSVSTLFSESWATLKKYYLKLLQLYLIGFGIIFGIVILFVIIAAIFGAGAFLINFRTAAAHTSFGPIFFVGAILLLIAIIAIIIVIAALQIAAILVISGKNEHNSPLKIFEQSFDFIGPMVAASLLSTLIILGGLFLLIIPGILFSIFFGFLSYEVVLNKQKGLDALKRSYLIFSNNFWGIFGRMLVLIVVSVAISIFLNMLTRGHEPLHGLFTLISFVINVAFGWLSICYTMLLYKKASAHLDSKPGKSIVWMVVLSIIGWVLAILIAFFAFAIYNTYKSTIPGDYNPPTPLESTPSSTSASVGY